MDVTEIQTAVTQQTEAWPLKHEDQRTEFTKASLHSASWLGTGRNGRGTNHQVIAKQQQEGSLTEVTPLA